MLPSPDISVIVPTYRRPRLLEGCLDSLRRQELEGDRYEVLVVDDGSGDETPQLLERIGRGWPNLRWKCQPSNLGPAAARNLAVQMARAPILLFVDDDIVATPTLLRNHLEAHQCRDPWLGVLGMVTWSPDLEITPFMRWLDTSEMLFGFAGMDAGPVEEPWTRFYTCNLSLWRSTFLTVGGFDERFPYPAHEDTHLSLRLVDRGFRLLFKPDALAFNARPLDLPSFRRRMAMVGEAAFLLSVLEPRYGGLMRRDLEESPMADWVRAAIARMGTFVPWSRLRNRCYGMLAVKSYRMGIDRARRQAHCQARGGGCL